MQTGNYKWYKILSDKELKKEGPGTSLSQKFDQSAWRWWSYGIEFIGVLGVFTYAGCWADQRWHTSPWLMFVGFFVAFVGMIYLLIKELAKIK